MKILLPLFAVLSLSTACSPTAQVSQTSAINVGGSGSAAVNVAPDGAIVWSRNLTTKSAKITCETTSGSPKVADIEEGIRKLRKAWDERKANVYTSFGILEKCLNAEFAKGPNRAVIAMCPSPVVGDANIWIAASSMANIGQWIVDNCRSKDKINGEYRVGGRYDEEFTSGSKLKITASKF